MATKSGKADMGNIDKQIAELMACNPIPEAEVKLLCEKVLSVSFRQKKS